MRQEKRKNNMERYHRLNEYFKWLLLGVITLTVPAHPDLSFFQPASPGPCGASRQTR